MKFDHVGNCDLQDLESSREFSNNDAHQLSMSGGFVSMITPDQEHPSSRKLGNRPTRPWIASKMASGISRASFNQAPVYSVDRRFSTWSGLSSRARLADTMPHVKVPTLILHPTADTEIRVRQALEIRDAAGADDVTYHEMKGAPHYLEGHRRAAMELVVDWLRQRYP